MKRRRFFRNMGSIALFGIAGTFLSFILIGIGAMLLSNWGVVSDVEGNSHTISTEESFVLGAVLSASDVVCALSLIQEEVTPRLHSILFGEAVINDAVGILLFHSLQKVNLSKINASSVFVFLGNFVWSSLASVALGVFGGMVAAFLTKHLSSLREDSTNQTAILFYVAFVTYISAELATISGVISLLVCSILMGHYAWYNLTPTAREVSGDTFKFLGNSAEALTFAYLGLSAFSYGGSEISVYFVLGIMGVVMLARLFGTFGLVFLTKLFTKFKYDLPYKSVSVIWIGGTIRGAVAFALISTVENKILQLTVLALVIVTTLGFGTFLPIWIKIVKPQENVEPIKKKVGLDVSGHLIEDEAGVSTTKYVIMKEDIVAKKSWLHKKWRNFDDKYLKPCLIDKRELRAQISSKSQLEAYAKEQEPSDSE